ncbi:hypothetical protein KSS87_018722 [Heliosperma pusillum]|nr:hypothetical protein KSS87_018722 [Heliosperma pusillum]
MENDEDSTVEVKDNDDWGSFRDDDIMNQHSAIRAEQTRNFPFVADKEPLSALFAEYQSGSPILLEKIKLFLEQLDSVVQVTGASISHDELVERSRDQSISDYVVMFFRFVTSGEIRKRSAFFEPFVLGLANTTVDQFCKTSVEPMGEESDHVHIIALSDALGVPIRIVYLDRSSCDAGGINVNHHDFVPISLMNVAGDGGCEIKPYVTLLYRPGHYDILYPKQ